MSADLDVRADPGSKAPQENFPVASRLLGRREREALLAVYGYARMVDDLGDLAPGDRLAQLDAVEGELRAVAEGAVATDPVLARLAPVLSSLDCGLAPFLALLEANRMDQRVNSYATFEDLRAYCELSAVPVGRIVLSVFEATSDERVALADDVCVGLQLVEHLQDVGEDAAAGRVYLPQSTLAAAGCATGDLHAASASPGLRRAVASESRRARGLLARAVPLARSLALRPRVAIAGFAGGGLAALDAIDRAECDVLAVRCRPGRRDVLRRTTGVLFGGGARWS